MRLAPVIFLFALLSCKGNKEKTQSTKSSDNSVVNSKDKPVVKHDSIAVDKSTKEEELVNASLNEKSKIKWKALNDKTAHWMKDAFDYFIVPKRKDDLNYPYITLGDFNADGKMDTAAVVTDPDHKKYQLAILLGSEIKYWDEDIMDDAAITTLAKPGEIMGMADDGNDIKSKKVKIKGDAIEVTYFEKASFVIYWNGKMFKRIQTSD